MKGLMFRALVGACLFFFASCHHDIDENRRLRGQEICNYPDWAIGETLPGRGVTAHGECYGISEWTEWRSDSGDRIRGFVGDSAVGSDFDGKYRVILSNQDIIIGFNDADASRVTLYNWYGDIKTGSLMDTIIEVPQEDASGNRFVYDCHCKKDMAEEADDSNRARAELTKIDDNGFSFKLAVAGSTVFDCDMRNGGNFIYNFADLSHIEDFRYVDYFPIGFLLKSDAERDYFTEKDIFIEIWPFFGGTESEQRNYSKVRLRCSCNLYCWEGISFRGISEDRKRISFNLLDSESSGYADYFEVSVKSRSDVSVTFYRMDGEEPVVVKSYGKPELYCKWYVSTETGQTEIV